MTALRKSMIAAALVLTTSTASAQTAIDGDTLQYKGVVVHLWGVDAPEKGQVCDDGWNAGQAASDRLAQLVRGATVLCTLKSADDAPRVAALCTADGKDLAAEMAKAGMAWALTRETTDYSVQETEAMVAIRGVHAHSCDKAREWRSKHRDKPQAQPGRPDGVRRV